jgi:hypothetical protein
LNPTGTLDFYYQVANNPNSVTAISCESDTSFLGFETSVAFRLDGGSLGTIVEWDSGNYRRAAIGKSRNRLVLIHGAIDATAGVNIFSEVKYANRLECLLPNEGNVGRIDS